MMASNGVCPNRLSTRNDSNLFMSSDKRNQSNERAGNHTTKHNLFMGFNLRFSLGSVMAAWRLVRSCVLQAQWRATRTIRTARPSTRV